MSVKIFLGLLFIISLLSITLVNGCTVASPNFYYINSIHSSTDPDIIILDVQENYFTEIYTLSLSLSSKVILKEMPEGVTKVDETFDGYRMQAMTLDENSSGVFIHYISKEGAIPVTYSFDVTGYNIDNRSSIFGLVYEKLDTIYIRYEFDYLAPHQLIGSLSDNIIVNNGTNIFPPHLSYIKNDLDVAISSSPDGGAMCGGPSYYKITETGFEFLASTVTGNRRLINPISEKLHILTYDWDTNSSKIQSYDIESGSSSVLMITAQELENIIFLGTSETSATLEFFGYIGVSGLILVVFVNKKNRKLRKIG